MTDHLPPEAAECTLCPLSAIRTQVVWGEGQGGGLLLLGEAPGGTEDRVGRPFVGQAGQALDRMLVEAGIERATCYLTNTIRCRPPGNDIKKAADALIKCQTWLAQEVRDAEPRVVITLGATASARFFPGLSVTQLSGAARVLELEGRMVVTVGTWHPSAYLRGHEESVRVAIVEALRRGKGLLER